MSGGMGSLKLEPEMAVFATREMHQSTPFWSNYFNKWMFLHNDAWPFGNVKCRTADRLEGPWEFHGDVAEMKPEGHPGGKGFRYCAVGHPEFDESGKRVLVTWTIDNQIWGVWIEWQ